MNPARKSDFRKLPKTFPKSPSPAPSGGGFAPRINTSGSLDNARFGLIGKNDILGKVEAPAENKQENK
ncbi:hypothetical protein KJ575_03720 [Patescibacteria group bacterium]|nr:hypothetical protein [Patescibacteria group bacterium]MBU4368785.1 hypothetical protein [Patescibacteria group bacterium]